MTVLHWLLLLSPLLLGYQYVIALKPLEASLGAGTAHWMLNLLFAVYWVWVGYYFARSARNPRRALVVGLAPSLIGPALLAFRAPVIRMGGLLITTSLEHYCIYQINWAARLLALVMRQTSSNVAIVVAYALMAGCFYLGFAMGKERRPARALSIDSVGRSR